MFPAVSRNRLVVLVGVEGEPAELVAFVVEDADFEAGDERSARRVTHRDRCPDAKPSLGTLGVNKPLDEVGLASAVTAAVAIAGMVLR